ncbi:hypothetical protein EV182_001246 [Spiromyces aspiralis]|uniref:Uncharacterized protein n=1 Tax=Spiromyces aspiralis TaxID=68401 RepID=A0ACC1HJN3_9FUNG|nr:hypothetical protein EV182_001246 [Spiromyces aspiralis]
MLPNVMPVVMSRSRDPDFMRSAISTGAYSYLIKPVSLQAMHGLWLAVESVSMSLHSHNHHHHHHHSCCRFSPPHTFPAFLYPPTCFPTRKTLPTANPRCMLFEHDFLSRFVPSMLSFDEHKVSSLEPLSADELGELRQALLQWSFNPYRFTESQLIHCAIIMLEEAVALAGLPVRASLIQSLILSLHAAYYDNAYHNFYHAIDVTQCTYYLLQTLGIFNPRRRSSITAHHEQRRFAAQRILKPIDVLALIVASLTHDAGHPGLNNVFMVKAKTQLATLYNDQSVLENFHAACFSMLMQRFSSQFREDRPDFDYDQVRKIAVQSILATDMARHFEFIEKCRAQHKRLQSGKCFPLTPQQEEMERLQVCTTIIKCADISNIVRSFHIAQSWTRRLEEELSKQAELECCLGMTPSMRVDGSKTASTQVVFYTKFGMPLFSAISTLLPELDFMEKQLRSNIAAWRAIDRQTFGAAGPGRSKRRQSVHVSPTDHLHFE